MYHLHYTVCKFNMRSAAVHINTLRFDKIIGIHVTPY